MSKTTIEHESVEEPADGATPSAASDEQLVAMLVDRARSEGLQLTGEGGLLQQLTKRVLEPALEGEITGHVGPVEVRVPRDTARCFEPQIVKKRQRRLSGVDEVVLSLSAKGLTHGEISAHLAEVYGAEVSKQTISTITDKVMEGMAELISCATASVARPVRAGTRLPRPSNPSTSPPANRRRRSGSGNSRKPGTGSIRRPSSCGRTPGPVRALPLL